MKKKYQVFVSSTYVDLAQERQELLRVLLELDCIPVGMELFPASGDSSVDYIKRVVDESDYYIIIIAGRYGSVASDTGISFTELEYNYARKSGKPILAFIKNDTNEISESDIDPETLSKLERFKSMVLSSHLCKFYDTPSDLGAAVATSLIAMIKNEPAAGWVKNDNVTEPSKRHSSQNSDNSNTLSLLKTYLITWDPSRFPFENFKKNVKEFLQNGTTIMTWNVGKKGLANGDRVFFMRHGKENPGLV